MLNRYLNEVTKLKKCYLNTINFSKNNLPTTISSKPIYNIYKITYLSNQTNKFKVIFAHLFKIDGEYTRDSDAVFYYFYEASAKNEHKCKHYEFERADYQKSWWINFIEP